MRITVYFKNFMESLSEKQKNEYREMSISQQKDWYIAFLETFFDSREYQITLARLKHS
jgi:hypothetical protein